MTVRPGRPGSRGNNSQEAAKVRLKDKAIVIPGAATGIGRAAAVCCAEEGARLVLSDVNEEECSRTVRLAEEAGGSAIFVRADVSVEEDVVRLMSEAESHLGTVDVLIHVAGIFRALRLQVNEVEESVWDEVIDVNLKGPFLAAKHVVPIMRKAGKGVIIIVASGAGVIGGSASVPYGSSKGGRAWAVPGPRQPPGAVQHTGPRLRPRQGRHQHHRVRSGHAEGPP